MLIGSPDRRSLFREGKVAAIDKRGRGSVYVSMSSLAREGKKRESNIGLLSLDVLARCAVSWAFGWWGIMFCRSDWSMGCGQHVTFANIGWLRIL